MTVYPIAKINLGLNVVDKRPDGYHDLETVFWPVSGIHDELTIDRADEEDVPTEDNLVTKAYRLLQKYHEVPPLKITLEKCIPMQAGMGGGSSDAAYTLRGINELCHLGLTTEQLQRYASMLGADCAFFINPVPSYATGIGDCLSPLALSPERGRESKWFNRLGDFKLVLLKPDVAVSTKEAYSNLPPFQERAGERLNCRDIILYEPIERWRDLLHNDFEDSIFPKLPVLQEIKEQLYLDGALYASMSGSGSTIFGIFEKDSFNIQHSTFNSHYAQYYYKILPF